MDPDTNEKPVDQRTDLVEAELHVCAHLSPRMGIFSDTYLSHRPQKTRAP